MRAAGIATACALLLAHPTWAEGVGCRFTNAVVEIAPAPTEADAFVARRIGAIIAEELPAIGGRAILDKASAAWEVLVIAQFNREGEGYVFSASLATRDGDERSGEQAGVSGLLASRDPAVTRVNYLGQGRDHELRAQVRDFLRVSQPMFTCHGIRWCERLSEQAGQERALELQIPPRPRRR